MHYLDIASVVFVSYMCFVKGQSTCITPDGVSGSCKSLLECEPLLAIIKNKSKDPTEIKFLKASHCGFQGKTPNVCCPPERPSSNGVVFAPHACVTPDGNNGKCINIHQCRHVTEMLNPSISPEQMDYVRKLRCTGPAEYSVCCAPAPTASTSPQRRDSCATTVSASPPDTASSCCGFDSRADSKLASVGGTITAIDQYPWVVLIEYHKNSTEKHLCGGVLISGRYVLTAAHCVVGNVLKLGTPRIVRLGEFDVRNDGPDCVETESGGTDCTDGVLKVPIESITPHPDYDPDTVERRNDIALIRLDRLAPYTDFIRPICLPETNRALQLPSNFTTFVAGWGALNTTHSSSDFKVHVDLPFVNAELCQKAYSAPGRMVPLWNRQMCAGGVKNKDSCKGDSGGPLMYENDSFYSFEVIGVVSFGPIVCGTENVPGIYTNVYEYKDWILSNIKP